MAKKTSGPKGLDPESLKSYVKLMRANGLVELEWQDGTKRLHLKTAGSMQVHAPLAVPSHALAHAAPVAPAPEALTPVAKASNLKPITSPFVGTFYRSSAPGAAPFVREGSRIKSGDVLCIVEAMKLMNQIEAESSGVIREILVENGQPVEFGETLFMVEA